MHDESSLRRLAEMGIDVYVPRNADGVELAASPAPADVPAMGATPVAPAHAERTAAAAATSIEDAASAPAPGVDILLLADAAATGREMLLAAVARTLAFARMSSAVARADDAAALNAARGLVVFGEAQSRTIGAKLSAQRQAQIGWVVTAEVARLRGDALGKRALWGELKRVVRLLRVPAR